MDMRSGLRYNCDECIAYETQAIPIRRLTKSTITELIRNSRRNTDLLVALESQLSVCYLSPILLSVKRLRSLDNPR